MTLGAKQELFARLLPFLLFRALQLGYQIRICEVLRTREQAQRNAENGTGIANSLHCDKLAVDILLTRDGAIIWDGEDAAYQELHDFWDSLHELTAERIRGDGGHFSITHGGRR